MKFARGQWLHSPYQRSGIAQSAAFLKTNSNRMGPNKLSPSSISVLTKRNPWFAKLGVKYQLQLLNNLQPIEFADQQLVVSMGRPHLKRDAGFMVLLHGSLKTSSSNSLGREAILSLVQPSQWFGELGLLDGQHPLRDVSSIGESLVGSVPSQVFAQLMQEPEFARHVTDLLCSRNRMLMGLVEDFSLRSARARCARRLLLLAYGDDMRHSRVNTILKVSHENLASMLGMTRQTLSNQLLVRAD